MAYTRPTWDNADPADSDKIGFGAGEIRDLKEDIDERFLADGVHLPEIAADPTTMPANCGAVYVKDDGGDSELYYKDAAAGNVVQMTEDGMSIIHDGTVHIYGFMTDGTPLFAKEIDIGFTSGALTNSGAHGVANAYTNNKIVCVEARTKYGAVVYHAYGRLNSMSISSMHWDDISLVLQRVHASGALVFNCLIIYK